MGQNSKAASQNGQPDPALSPKRKPLAKPPPKDLDTKDKEKESSSIEKEIEAIPSPQSATNWVNTPFSSPKAVNNRNAQKSREPEPEHGVKAAE